MAKGHTAVSIPDELHEDMEEFRETVENIIGFKPSKRQMIESMFQHYKNYELSRLKEFGAETIGE